MEQNLDSVIEQLYSEKKNKVLSYSASNDSEVAMESLYDLWMFMNRFRQCDLQNYYDDQLHKAMADLNPRTFDTSDLLKEKNIFRIAYIIPSFSDTGGASYPQRFMLPYYNYDGIKIEQYVLLTNLKNDESFRTTEEYRYLCEQIDCKEFESLPVGLSWT